VFEMRIRGEGDGTAADESVIGRKKWWRFWKWWVEQGLGIGIGSPSLK